MVGRERTGHEKAAAALRRAAAVLPCCGQRERDISSTRPWSYAASREARSAPSWMSSPASAILSLARSVAFATLSPTDSPSAPRQASLASVLVSRTCDLRSFMSLITKLLSSLNRGGRRGHLEPSHRRLLDAHWQLSVELQPDHRSSRGSRGQEVTSHDQRNRYRTHGNDPFAWGERRRSRWERGGHAGSRARGSERARGRWTL